MTLSSGAPAKSRTRLDTSLLPDKPEDTFSPALRNGHNRQKKKKFIMIRPIGLGHQDYSLLNASIGSMFEALHAGYRPDRMQTTTPMIIPYGT